MDLLKRKKQKSCILWIVGINVVIFLAVLIMEYSGLKVSQHLSLKPVDVMAGKNLWTIITSMFMHAGFWHLFVNMLSLVFLGSFLERIIGAKRFLLIYFISGISASLFFVFLSYFFGGSSLGALIFGSPLIPAVGASGAIFGIAGVLVILTPKTKIYLMFIPIGMQMWFGVILILAVMWLFSILAKLPVGNTAHLGGLLAGLAYGIFIKKKYRRKIEMINQMMWG